MYIVRGDSFITIKKRFKRDLLNVDHPVTLFEELFKQLLASILAPLTRDETNPDPLELCHLQ